MRRLVGESGANASIVRLEGRAGMITLSFDSNPASRNILNKTVLILVLLVSLS